MTLIFIMAMLMLHLTLKLNRAYRDARAAEKMFRESAAELESIIRRLNGEPTLRVIKGGLSDEEAPRVS